MTDCFEDGSNYVTRQVSIACPNAESMLFDVNIRDCTPKGALAPKDAKATHIVLDSSNSAELIHTLVLSDYFNYEAECDNVIIH